jgi:toxin YoeB
MRQLTFDSEAFDDFCNWAIYDKQTFKKILDLLKSIKRTPFQGIGKPEHLKFKQADYWSRRINHDTDLFTKLMTKTIFLLLAVRVITINPSILY